MVRLAGLEPTTLCLEGRCSIQLSYRRDRNDISDGTVNVQASFNCWAVTGRILTLPPIATLAERGCVVLDQPQQVGKHWSLQQCDNAGTLDLLETPVLSNLLRLVEDDTAALRQSRDRGQCQDAPMLDGKVRF